MHNQSAYPQYDGLSLPIVQLPIRAGLRKATPTRRRSRLQQPGAGLWVGGFLAACLPLVYIAADLVGAR